MINRLRLLVRPLLTGAIIAMLLLLLLSGNYFTSLNIGLTNAYYVSTPTSDTIVIVALDDDSFARFGRTPTLWDRTVYADLTDVLAAGEARVIAFDLLFSEPSAADDTFAAAVERARQSDTRTRFVFASAGVQVPAMVEASSGYTRGLSYENVLLPVAALDAQADYRGYVNAFPDSDTRLRRQPSIVQTAEGNTTRINLSFSLATYLAYLRVPALALTQVITQHGETLDVTPERTIPVDRNGFWRQNYFGTSSTQGTPTFPFVSLQAVLDGEVAPDIFKGKIVLVGIMNSTGATDQAVVPISPFPMAGVEIQANALETIIQNKPLLEQSRLAEMWVIVLFSLGSTLVYHVVGWKMKVILAVVFVLIYVSVSFIQFSASAQVNNFLYPSLGLIIPAIITLGFDITKEITLRIRTEAQVHLLEELNSKTEAEKHLLEELNRKTEAEKENLNNLSELKTRMIRMASHDLKNPLGRVFGYAELLLMDDNLSKDQVTFVKNIRQSGEEMNTLITEILNLEQLKSGNLVMDYISFSDLVAQVVTRHDPDFYRKNQTYVHDISQEPIIVYADTRQMSQAVSNLIGNAVKYTPDGGTITVRVFAKEGKAHLEVHDTGYGMPADALPKLFAEFYRVRTQATQNIRGTGLGLSLVKQVVEVHQGDIRVESEEGKGSAFFMEMPLAAANATVSRLDVDLINM